jgi:hypothetical protein
MMHSRGTPRALAVACSAAALLVLVAAQSAGGAKAKSPWQLFGRTKAQVGYGLLGPFWASNRVWVLPQWGDAGTLASARVSGTTLGSFTTQGADRRVVNGVVPTGAPFVDGRLIVRPDEGFATAPLLPDGRLGPAVVAPDDFPARAKEAAPKVQFDTPEAAVRVGDRLVWLLEGGELVGLGGKQYQLVCCNESGAATDLTRFIDQSKGVLFVQVGVDTHGRIWVAWLDRANAARGAVLGAPRIFELDRATLAPRTEPLAAPGTFATRLKLVCSSSCRLVAQTVAGDIVSWAPGERSPTRVVSGWRPAKVPGAVEPASLLDATYRSGHLVVGYQGSRGKTQYVDATVRDEIRVVRGDARGARAREVGTIPVANTWPPENVSAITNSPIVSGAFTSTALIAVEWFQGTRGGQWSPVVAAVVPLGR